MLKTAINGAIGFSALSIGATIDAALGLGGVAWIAEICFTDETAMGAMDMAPREINPVPLIGLSLTSSVAAFALISHEHARSLSVRARPSTEDQASILSAMLAVACLLGKTSRAELAGFYRIATHNDLDPAIADLAFERFEQMRDTGAFACSIAKPKTALGRRRVLAAAMLMARKPEAMRPEVEALIQDIIEQVGVTVEDADCVFQALDAWDADCPQATAVPLFSLLRDRPLALRTA